MPCRAESQPQGRWFLPVGTPDRESNQKAGCCNGQEDQNHPRVFNKYGNNRDQQQSAGPSAENAEVLFVDSGGATMEAD